MDRCSVKKQGDGNRDANISDTWPCVPTSSHTLSGLTKFGDIFHCNFSVRAPMHVSCKSFKEFCLMCCFHYPLLPWSTYWVFKILTFSGGSSVDQANARDALWPGPRCAVGSVGPDVPSLSRWDPLQPWAEEDKIWVCWEGFLRSHLPSFMSFSKGEWRCQWGFKPLKYGFFNEQTSTNQQTIT